MLCSRCRQDLPTDQFGPSAAMYPRQRECKECNRRKQSIRKHGIDASQKKLIAEAQGGCRICGHHEPGTKGWVLDHDRTCCPGDASCPKCRRGVLCAWCNHMLGCAFDRPQILRAAADYLERERDCVWHMPVACALSICGVDPSSNATDGRDGEDVLTEMELRNDESFS